MNQAHTIEKAPASLCRGGKPCSTPPSGGGCAQCGFPIAYAHPESLLDAFRVEAIWIGGTAIRVEQQSSLPPDIVVVLQNDGSSREYPIPPEQASPGSLDVRIRKSLLEFATSLRCLDQESSHTLSFALIEGIAALSYGWLSPTHREVLLQFMRLPDFCGTTFLESGMLVTAPGLLMVSHVEALLREVDRLERLYLGISGIGLVIDDNRHNLDVASLGPFSKPLSRLRIALLPGEADHVELYDIRVGERQNCPIGVSMIHRLSIYTPKNVREIPEPVNISGAHVGKYLPGALLTGKLREEAHSKDPARLFSDDLLGGVEINLGRTFPPMSYVYLYYRVAPGHVFCAVVEPLKNEPVS